MTDTQQIAKPGRLLRGDDWEFEYRQKCAPETSNLDLLTYGTYRIRAGAASGELHHHSEEALLFSLAGEQSIQVGNQTFRMSHYDTLYIPLGTSYRIRSENQTDGLVAVFRTPGQNRHAPFHARWEEVRNNEARIRHLDGKDVFLMYDVSEAGDRLLGGYTIYEPHTRAWPPHNHTDQEEIYLFTQGSGAMEVYPDEQSKTFVQSVQALDAVAIPLLNFHPVFSQDEELHFIWCIAGERYWVGDKHKEFMDGSVETLTT
jgi:mannose-6-phosphate isomerase-like protein (cupin superfamily)